MHYGLPPVPMSLGGFTVAGRRKGTPSNSLTVIDRNIDPRIMEITSHPFRVGDVDLHSFNTGTFIHRSNLRYDTQHKTTTSQMQHVRELIHDDTNVDTNYDRPIGFTDQAYRHRTLVPGRLQTETLWEKLDIHCSMSAGRKNIPGIHSEQILPLTIISLDHNFDP